MPILPNCGGSTACPSGQSCSVSASSTDPKIGKCTNSTLQPGDACSNSTVIDQSSFGIFNSPCGEALVCVQGSCQPIEDLNPSNATTSLIFDTIVGQGSNGTSIARVQVDGPHQLLFDARNDTVSIDTEDCLSPDGSIKCSGMYFLIKGTAVN